MYCLTEQSANNSDFSGINRASIVKPNPYLKVEKTTHGYYKKSVSSTTMDMIMGTTNTSYAVKKSSFTKLIFIVI